MEHREDVQKCDFCSLFKQLSNLFKQITNLFEQIVEHILYVLFGAP